MELQIGIVDNPGSFSDRWIEYCLHNNISYYSICPYSINVIEQTKALDCFLWHWMQSDFRASLFAKQLIITMCLQGKNTFPDLKTCWYFDDKVAQKYMLESISAPITPTWIFYSMDEALDWISQTTFPKVFKLRKGASSSNVKLVKSAQEARQLCRTAFSSGFTPIPSYTNDLRRKIYQTQHQKSYLSKLLRFPSTIKSLSKIRKEFPPERGYVYFQEFMPGNLYDTRITIIGDRGFGFIRRNRPGDFRASGSGLLELDPKFIDLSVIAIAFDIARKIGSQSMAMDFVYDAQKHPVLLEVSHVYVASLVYQCSGYWDSSLNWHAGHVWPQDAIFEDIIARSKPS